VGGRQRSAFNATAAGVPYNGDGGGDTESHGTGSRGRTARVRPWNSSGSGLLPPSHNLSIWSIQIFAHNVSTCSVLWVPLPLKNLVSVSFLTAQCAPLKKKTAQCARERETGGAALLAALLRCPSQCRSSTAPARGAGTEATS
jgi:hypothetical protein